MHKRTIATLAQLESAIWFSKVGVHDTELAIVLASWKQAIVQCSDREWQNSRLRMANNLRMKLLKQAKERFVKWNEIAVEVKGVVVPLVKQRIESIVRENQLPQAFENAVRWDIVHLCMEAEYADVCPPGFYAGQAYWYVKGHFPCGWDPTFPPKGRPIVY